MPVITETFYAPDRATWRRWLSENHDTKQEIWLQRYIKASGIPSVSYDDLVEECLCFGWIDGVQKKFDTQSHVQRITPRRAKGSFLSELNRQRAWKLVRDGKMTEKGLTVLGGKLGDPDDPFSIPDAIRTELELDPEVWANFRAFPHFYQRLKIGWITEITGNSRQEEVRKRLNHLIKMTKAGKRYGTEPLAHWE